GADTGAGAGAGAGPDTGADTGAGAGAGAFSPSGTAADDRTAPAALSCNMSPRTIAQRGLR
ncbi:MAG TPA: hypothetical protein VK162_17700, partial [Streptosporangiaceae bacterium]|nr:hypothetical protein [Streptosporangiaceae bacterium]